MTAPGSRTLAEDRRLRPGGGPAAPAEPGGAPGLRHNGVVTTPPRSLPAEIERWTSRVRFLRWLDALAGGLVLWAAVAAALPPVPVDAQGLLALAMLGIVALVPPLRSRWRPVSGWAALALSRDLRPGDHAWWVRPGRADLVLVTARRGTRLIIAIPDHDASEAMSVRRTRTLFLPAEPRRGGRTGTGP